jgi:hypothetical protein
VKFSEIAGRITGISTPIFGVQWTPPRVDVDVAREVIVFLEDRRVLYSPYEAEMPEYVVRSVLDIRQFMTDCLRRGGIASELADALSAMRTACRKFIESVGERRGPELILPSPGDILHGGTPGWIFNQALGEMRGVFGLHIAQLAVRYGIDVPDQLAVILPLATAEDREVDVRARGHRL